MARNFVAASSQFLEFIGTLPVSAVPLTFACWFRDDATSIRSLMSMETSTGTEQNFRMFTNAGVLNLASSDVGSGGTATCSAGYTANVWHSAIGVFASATSRQIYIDGGSSGTNATSAVPTSLARIEVGRTYQNGSPIQFMNGDIARVAMWNIALSSADRASLAAGALPSTIQAGNLVFYAPLAGTASPEPDLINANNLTVTGATQTSIAPVNPPVLTVQTVTAPQPQVAVLAMQSQRGKAFSVTQAQAATLARMLMKGSALTTTQGQLATLAMRSFVPRKLNFTGSADTAPSLTGRVTTAISWTGSES